MELDFWKHDVWRSEYVRIINTTEDDTALSLQRVMCGFVGFVDTYTEVVHGFHITWYFYFVNFYSCKLERYNFFLICMTYFITCKAQNALFTIYLYFFVYFDFDQYIK